MSNPNLEGKVKVLILPGSVKHPEIFSNIGNWARSQACLAWVPIFFLIAEPKGNLESIYSKVIFPILIQMSLGESYLVTLS